MVQWFQEFSLLHYILPIQRRTVWTFWAWNICVAFASSCTVVYLFDWSFQISCPVCWYLSDRPPIFHPQHFPTTACPVWKGHYAALPTLCATQDFWVFCLRLGHRLRLACPDSSLVEPNPICALIGRIQLRRVERRSRRICARRATCSSEESCLSLLTFTQATGPSVDIRRRLLRLLHKYLIGRGPNI